MEELSQFLFGLIPTIHPITFSLLIGGLLSLIIRFVAPYLPSREEGRSSLESRQLPHLNGRIFSNGTSTVTGNGTSSCSSVPTANENIPKIEMPSLVASTPQIADTKTDSSLVPLSVNYHFTRKCNYSCGFCFHTAKTSFHLPLDEAKRGLRALRDAGETFNSVFILRLFKGFYGKLRITQSRITRIIV